MSIHPSTPRIRGFSQSGFNQLGDILANPFKPGATDGFRRSTVRRTGEPVRRHSYLAGSEGVFWRPMQRQEARKIVFAAKRFELSTRKPGSRNGALGHVALEILDLLANLMNQRTGRLDPSLEFIMTTLHRSRDAVVRALKALREHGFLAWKRRYIKTGNSVGPQVQQTSNAYKLLSPKAISQLLSIYFQPAPTPADEEHRINELMAALEDYKKQMSLAELPLFVMGSDDPLAQALARLGASIAEKEKRESARQSESL